jgi:hypothetical protein
MFSRSAFLLLTQAIAAIAHPSKYEDDKSTKNELNWGKCPFKGATPIECANLTVPLDYSDLKSDKKLTLELLRVPASKKPSKGSILTNFGGPGIVGRKDLASAGALLQE